MPEANKLQLVQGDALNLDYRQWGKDLRLIGNLPYNISTALITQLLCDVDWIEDMHFMVQKEVAERLVASPSCKAYGRLTVFLQYHCAAEYLFTVPASAFYPAPKVESAVVRLRPYRQRPYEAVDVTVLERVIAMAFAMRRKTLANNLKALLKADELVALGIDPSRRPEQIPIAEYVQIVKFVSS
jgi:16S rRNA (adenine1518-N6/adenine1519-N6)-dimethyltransferase